jgi:hypothetical protein
LREFKEKVKNWRVERNGYSWIMMWSSLFPVVLKQDMFVDHVRCLHNQIHTVLKMCSTKQNLYTNLRYWVWAMVVCSLMLFIYSQVVINTGPYWYTQLCFLLDRFNLSSWGYWKYLPDMTVLSKHF